jgi:hypothetical protein
VIRRFLVWLGFVHTWFTIKEFEQKVGRPPCVACIRDHDEDPQRLLLLCDYDLDAWFDAVLA